MSGATPRGRAIRCAVITALVGAAFAVPAWAWTTVGPGIEYQEFQLPDPNKVFVARMDRRNSQCFVDSTLGGSRLGTSETIGSQASRYDDALNYWNQDWGARNDVIVAINGDFVDTDTNTPLNSHIMSGWYTKPRSTSTRLFYYLPDQDLAIGYGPEVYQTVQFLASGQSMNILGLNRARGTDDLVVYTPQFNTTTRTDNTGLEVLVEMTRPMSIASSAEAPVGTIRQIRQNAGSTPIPFDHVVISATGTPATNLLARATVGQRVSIAFNLSGSPLSLDKTYAGIGGGEVFLGNGEVWGGQDIRHPRTAIAYNDDYLFFVVVDGRSSISVGMTMTELGNFCKNYLGATWGVNEDGGGSSTMIVNGTLKNKPSDGSQRAVVNGMFMGINQAKQQSTVFSSGDLVKTTSTSNTVRLGPGTNYLSTSTVGKDAVATIVDHHLRGVYAKGIYWWKCDFGSSVGWVSQNLLTSVATGNLPRFSQHPSAQHVCPGSNAAFAVNASGTGTLSYRWQFNGTDLSDNSTYSGTNTSRLVVTNAQSPHAGSYRCIATDANGSTTSWSVPLRVMIPTSIVIHPESRIDPLVGRGTDVSFRVVARGEGPLSYQWQKNGVDIPNSAEYSGATTSTLTVLAADTSDEGEYRCRVSGGCQTAHSNPAQLAVLSTDLDRDGDVDQADFGILQVCFSGTTIPQRDPACRGTNLDADAEQDVDLDDLNALMQCFSGPGVPRRPGC